MRMPRQVAVAVLLAIAPAISSVPAYSQSATDDPMMTMARARFKEGVEFYDRGEYEQARASFMQAYALKKHPAVLLNLAWSCLKSGHALDADRYFKQFLAEGKEITEKQRADANDGLTQARAKLGRIDVLAAAGTEVTIDGDRVGTMPLAEPVVVEVGAHTVKFKAPDGTTDTESVTVVGGEKSTARFKTFSLVPGTPGPPAPIAASSTEAGALAASPAPHDDIRPEATNRETVRASATEQADEGTGRSVFSPPQHIWPVIVLGSVAAAGYIGAGVMLYFKGQAQSKADDLHDQIKSKGGGCPPSTSQAARFGSACNALSTDDGQVNDDATAGNVLLGVGIAATAGAIVYWLVAEKRDGHAAAAKPVFTPLVGPTVGGLSFSGQF